MNIRNYLLNAVFLPGRFEEVSRARNFDVIIPQGFGRNMYPDESRLLWFRDRFWRIAGKGKEKGKSTSVFTVGVLRDCVGSDMDAFERLKSLDFNPGRPNEILAEICVNSVQKKRVHIVGQWEVMYAIWERFPLWYSLNSDRFIVIWPPRNGYLSTRGMLLEVKRIADERELENPCVVAHPEHMPRVYFLARKIFGKPVAMMTEVMSDEWFDPKSVQWWTRGKWVWLVYEMLVRAHHRYRGRI